MRIFSSQYQRLSFRSRLLLLLVIVSLVQAGVAAYTFFDLQSKPAKQRAQAQLNAAMRGAAPVFDEQLDKANKTLIELLDTKQLQSLVEKQNWEQLNERILDLSAGGTTAYVTDSSGNVVAGIQPEGVLISQPGVTSSQITQGSDLLATINVPVAVDSRFLEERISKYIPNGVELFVADEESLISSTSPTPVERPAGLRPGFIDADFAGTDKTALLQPMLDGSIVVGAAVPTSVIADQQKQGISALWGFIFLLAMLMIGMALFITRAVNGALRRFATTARTLAGGELGLRIPVTGDDEIAKLSTSFNDMAESLQDRIESLHDARGRMKGQVERFGDALANTTENVDRMLETVCSLALESMERSHAKHARFWTIDEDGHYRLSACINLRPGDTEPCELEKLVPRTGKRQLQQSSEPAWLVVPARRSDGQILGMLTLVSTERQFSEDDIWMADRIAVLAAVGIENTRMHVRLREQATRDGLTGLPNHRSLQDELTKRLAEAYASDMPLGVAMLDIDNFKRVNDTYGHPVGDETIKAIGKTLAHGVGGMGMVGRYGGEEFVVIMPGCDAETAARIADRLREDITHIEVPLEDGGVLKVTSSFGVAALDKQKPETVVDNTELLRQADVGLYNSKRSGKNCVTISDPDMEVIEMSDVEKAKLEARERGDNAAEQAAAEQLVDPFDLAA